MPLKATDIENAGTCQHDPLAPCCTLVVESNWMGQRIRCFVCDRANDLGRKGHFGKAGAQQPAAGDGP